MLRVRTDADVVQPSLELECDLCESWQFAAPSSFRFTLRPEVKWHGAPPVRGRELTATDVACSYERISGRKLTPRTFSCNFDIPFPEEAPNAALLNNVRAIEVEGPLTLRIDLNAEFPDADFLLALADGHAKIVAAEAVNVNGDLKLGPDIGTGPWLSSDVDINLRAILTRNPEYFEDGLPFLDEIVTTVIGDSGAGLAAFLVGQAQVHRVDPGEWSQILAGQRSPETVVVPHVGTGLILSMNTTQAPFDNHMVRQALLQALDPWDYVGSIWAGNGDVTVGIPAVRADWLLERRDLRDDYFADPAAARTALQSANPSGPVQFDLLVGDFGDLHRAQGRRLEQDLQAAGFNPQVQFLTPPQYATRIFADKQYQAALGVIPPTTSTNSFLLSLLHSQGQWNLSAHSDTALDQMIQKQAVQLDLEIRGEQVRDIQRHVLDQAYLFSPVTGATRWVMDPAVQGFFPTTAASEYFFWAKTWKQPGG
jgi:peptide/nickel transport system substrate-binding protein